MTVGIIGAMDEEIRLIKANMTSAEEITVANSLFVTGMLNDQHVVLLKSGIGKVNAAMATTIMHETFHPEQVINTGTAGGAGSALVVGDIIISTAVLHHDVDATAFDYVYGQVPKMPPRYKADAYLMDLTRQATLMYDVPAHEGVIATGDTFMSDSERVRAVCERFPDIVALEMEAAAIAQVCYQYDVPFVIIRALSDIAGKTSSVSFETFVDKAANNAASLIHEVVSQL